MQETVWDRKGAGKKAQGEDDRARIAAILGPALSAFEQYGYRKCSLEEVARAAGVSRQAIYLFFANKEEVFRAAVRYELDRRLESARAALARGTPEIGLVQALEEWVGQYAGGLMSAETGELVREARAMAGEVVSAGEKALMKTLAGVIEETELGAAYRRAEVSAEELAGMLYAMARGLRESCGTRREFADRMRVAVRVLWAAGR